MARNVFEYANEKGVNLTEAQKQYLFNVSQGVTTFVFMPEKDREIAEEIYFGFINSQDDATVTGHIE